MRGYNGLPLPDDIIKRILTFLPSFSSLFSTILTSKSFHEIYKTHPKSILRAVAYNVTGPALPQALRVVRYRVPDSSSGSSNSDSETEDEDEEANADAEQEQGLAYGTDEKAPITLNEARQITENARVASELEDLWSFRYKDRTSRQSKLTPTESWHFRRAMYRIMLYNRVSSIKKYTDAHDLDNFIDADSLVDSDLQLERTKRTKFMSQFSTDELLQIRSVGIYLMEILEFVDMVDIPQAILSLTGDIPPLPVFTRIEDSFMKHVALCIGPKCVLQCYKRISLDPVDDAIEVIDEDWEEMFKDYLTHPISKVFEERRLNLPPEDFTHWYSISSEVNENNDECDQCHESAEFRLFCRLNWVERCPEPGFFVSSSIETLLKGYLSENQVERVYLDKQTRVLHKYQEQGASANWLSTVVNDIFDDNLLRPGFQNWTKDDYLCDKCFKIFLKEHLWVWLLEYKKKSEYGVTIEEDCWYGYNCRTQTHRPLHAKKLNHLCEPSRGNAP